MKIELHIKCPILNRNINWIQGMADWNFTELLRTYTQLPFQSISLPVVGLGLLFGATCPGPGRPFGLNLF